MIGLPRFMGLVMLWFVNLAAWMCAMAFVWERAGGFCDYLPPLLVTISFLFATTISVGIGFAVHGLYGKR